MRVRHPRTLSLAAVRRTAQPAHSSGGFTIIELITVMAIALVMLTISLPIIKTTLTNMHLNSSATTIAGIIQSTRYQAISAGCPYEVVLTAANNSYQILDETITTSPTAPPQCSATYSNIGNNGVSYRLIPFASSDVAFTVTPSSTLVLNPSGTVSAVGSVTTPATFTIRFSPAAGGSATKTVTVSGVGNVGIQ